MKKELIHKTQTGQKYNKIIFPTILIVVCALIFGYFKSYISTIILIICMCGILVLLGFLYYKGIIKMNKPNVSKKVSKKITKHQDDKDKNEPAKLLSSTDIPIYKGKSSEKEKE